MSGTSLDGIDLAEVIFTVSDQGNWNFKVLSSKTTLYSLEIKQHLQEAISYTEEQLNEFNKHYTKYLASVIAEFISAHRIKNIDAVCSHGHTIFHQPEKGLTLQIGNLPQLATLIHQKVVCDFRIQDIAFGGQGAPLVPIGDELLFSGYDYCLNLGGFANVSFEYEQKRIAYDICPVNIILNPLAEKLGFSYDDKGSLAQKGKIIISLLSDLNNLSYYKEKPPKSLGIEWVKEQINPILENSSASPNDKLRTLTEHIAYILSNQFRKGSKVLVTGGGAYNTFLLNRIQFYKKLNLTIPLPEIIEFKEAIIFGLLGVLKIRKEINCLASVTGAKKDHSSGYIFLP